MGAVFGREGEEVDAVEDGFAGGDGESRVAGKHAREGALARSVGAHDGVDFAGAYGEVDTAKDFLAIDAGMQIAYFQ